jgi:hypothetical protein
MPDDLFHGRPVVQQQYNIGRYVIGGDHKNAGIICKTGLSDKYRRK